MADPYKERSEAVSNRMDETLLNDILRQRETVNAPATLNRPLLMQLMNQMNRGNPVPVSPFPLPAVPKMVPEVPASENPMFRNFNGGQGFIKGGLEGILDVLVGQAHASSPMESQAPYMGVLGPMVGPQLPANPMARHINGVLAKESVPDLIRRLKGEKPPVPKAYGMPLGLIRG